MQTYNARLLFKWLPLLLCAVLLAGVLLFYCSPKQTALQLVRRHPIALQTAAETVMALGYVPEEVRFQRLDIRYLPSANTVCFQISKRGIGSSTVEQGFYYSPTGAPRSFGSGGGDYWDCSEQLAEHWYWYELRA